MAGWPSHRLTRVTAPAVEPVTLPDAKAHLRVTWDQEDTLIGNLVAAARAEAEAFTRRSLVNQDWQLTLDGFPPGGYPIELMRPPVQSITSFVYDSDADVDQAVSHVFVPDDVAARLLPPDGSGWPSPGSGPGPVRIRYRAGFGADSNAMPPDIRQALLLIVGRLYAFREDMTMRPAASIPMGSRHLLSPYRIFV